MPLADPPAAPPAAPPAVVVIGGGVGGLCAAIDLARRGLRVSLVERHAHLGGKLRTTPVAGRDLDAGPTVLTMRHVFDGLFADAGADLDARLLLRPARVLARHAWGDGARLDLHADPERSREAIAQAFGEAEAQGFDRFRAAARATYEEVERSFIFAQRPSVLDLARGTGASPLVRLARIDAHRSLWRALSDSFRDPHLRQLFGRYATYTGGSPFLSPATLKLVAHVELAGVWTVQGGMARLADALADLARELGVDLRPGCPVAGLSVAGGRVRGVVLEQGELLAADAVVANVDTAALARGLLGPEARAAVDPIPPARRSLSALTLGLVARTSGLPLVHHNVFFGDDYPGEFDRIFRQGRLPADPTVYACAQDRADEEAVVRGAERLLLIINAPARGDMRPPPDEEIQACTEATLARLARNGLHLEPVGPPLSTRPQDWEALFPGTGGALYGGAPHGWRSSFQRSGAKSRLPGLYLAGGSVHPGAGLPMVAVSGRLAAERVASDLGWTGPCRRVDTPGGTSTSSPTTAATG